MLLLPINFDGATSSSHFVIFFVIHLKVFFCLIEAYANIIPLLQSWGSNFSIKPATNKIRFCFPVPLGCHFSVKEYTTEVPMNLLMIMYLWWCRLQKQLNIIWLHTLPPIMNLLKHSYLKKSWLTAHFTKKTPNWTHFETHTPPIDYNWLMLLMLW